MLTRSDIAELLASVGIPGKKQAEKEQAVLDLYAAFGSSPHNTQGHSVITTLDSYEDF